MHIQGVQKSCYFLRKLRVKSQFENDSQDNQLCLYIFCLKVKFQVPSPSGLHQHDKI